jgi:hypothetical protein
MVRVAERLSASHLPTLRVLGYQPTRPRLRLLRLPEERVEPSPVALDAAECALDRDGWLVFTPNAEVWGVPASLEGRAFRVGRWWDCVPAPNPRTVWLANPVDPDPSGGLDHDAPTVLVEYDGVVRQEIDRRELPGSLRLEAAVPEGWILRGARDGAGDADALLLWRWRGSSGTPVSSGYYVLASHGSLLAVAHRDGRLSFVDAGTGTETPVSNPLAGGWHDSGAFSPDGAQFAIGVREQLDGPASAQLALVDTATGAAALATGRFDNFATTPVWSQDGAWLIFDAPFDTSLFACHVRAASPTLVPVVRRRGRPVPLIDVGSSGA